MKRLFGALLLVCCWSRLVGNQHARNPCCCVWGNSLAVLHIGRFDRVSQRFHPQKTVAILPSYPWIGLGISTWLLGNEACRRARPPHVLILTIHPAKMLGCLKPYGPVDIIMGYHGILGISTALLDFFQQLDVVCPAEILFEGSKVGPRLKSFWSKLGASKMKAMMQSEFFTTERPPFSAVNQTKVVGRYHLGLSDMNFLKSLQLPVGENRFFSKESTKSQELMCIRDPHVHPQFHLLQLLLPWCQRIRVMWRRRPRNEARRRRRLPSLHCRAWPTLVKPQPLKETMVKRDKKNPRSGWGPIKKHPVL